MPFPSPKRPPPLSAFFWGKVSGQKCLDGFAAAAPSAARKAPANKPLLGRPPKRKDAAPRVRRSGDQITCEDAASAGLQKPLGERPHKEPEQLDPEGRKSQAGQKRKQLPEQGQIKQGKGKQRGSLCFLCLLLSDDKQKLAFINAVYLKKETEKGGGAAAAGERRRQGSSSKGSICADTQTGKQQQQQMQQQQ